MSLTQSIPNQPFLVDMPRTWHIFIATHWDAHVNVLKESNLLLRCVQQQLRRPLPDNVKCAYKFAFREPNAHTPPKNSRQPGGSF